MNTFHTYLLRLIACAVFLFAGSLHISAQSHAWMQALPDDRPITTLCIPGAHDATTGEGLFSPFGLGVTQQYTLAQLWDLGVRAFDLRPAVRDTTLHIYHGRLRIWMTFDQAMQTLCRKLAENPSEFAAVILREEVEAESDRERALWPHRVGQCLNRYSAYIAPLVSGMQVRDLRGKILLLSRNDYTDTTLGGRIHGWSHSADGSTDARIVPMNGSASIPLRVQDYYNTVGQERIAQKLSAVQSIISASASGLCQPVTGRATSDTTDPVLTLNFLSAYATTWLRIPGMATARGYLRNAEAVHHHVLSYLAAHPTSMPCGIHFLDFAGVDTIKRGGHTYSPLSGAVLKQIIEENFR